MRTLNLFWQTAVIGALITQVPLAEAQSLTQTLSFTIGNTAITIGYPDGWSSAQPTLNTWVLLNVPLAQQATGTPTIRVDIGYQVRVDHTDALNQLQQIANESATAGTFLTIGGWPGFQRVQTVPRPQAGEADEVVAGEQMIQITTAVAADNLLLRIEADLTSGTDQATQNLVLAIGQSLTFSSTPPPAQIQQELKQLKRAPRRSQSKQHVAARVAKRHVPANIATTLPGTAGGTLSPLMSDLAGPISPLLNLGLGNGELEISVSNNGMDVVIGRQSVWVTSNDGGQTFPYSGSLPVGDGDSSLAFGQSGNFYHAALFGGACPANSNCVEIANSTTNGQTFGALGNALVCPNSGGSACSVDQEHIAADRVNAAAGGKDRVYMGFRDCQGGCGGKSDVNCSPDSGATWSPRFALEGGSDFPRVTVGQDGSFYAVYHNGGNIRIDKFNACSTSASLMTRASGSFPNTVSSFSNVAGCEVASGFPGLDRCNDGNILSSPMVAVDDTNPNHIYVSWATNTAANNENVMVADSNDGGKTWRTPVTINTGVTARRFMPWVCPTGGNAFVTWYGRDAATVANNDLTDFFAASAGLSSGNLVANNDQFQISAASDPQCRLWPASPRSVFDSENCSVQPENAGTCSITTSIRCDFSGGGTTCPVGETCKTGGGAPKYGDYNGNACVLGRLYATFATGKNANGTNNTRVTDFFQSYVVGSTPTTLTYNGDITQDFHDTANLSAVLTLSGTASVGVTGQTITFTLGSQTCMGMTNSAGLAGCSVTLTQTPGPYTVMASFAGSGNYIASSGSSPFTITREETTLTYNGDTVVGNGNTAHMSATLLEDGNPAVPLASRSVSFTLGTGGSAQTCSGPTSAAGVATCNIVVNQPFGAQPIAVSFAGDTFYLPSSTSASLFVPEPPQITKAFGDSQIQLFFGFTSLSFTVTNPNPIALAGIAFSDTLPSGLIVFTPGSSLMGSCDGGVITAVPASNVISLSGATLTSGASCTFSVLVLGAAIGVQQNSTSAITSTTAGGLTGSPASASVSVVITEFLWFFLESGGGH